MCEERIDLAELRGACGHELARVRAEWPDGVPITAMSLDRAIALGLDLEWAAMRLLRGPARAEYERAYGLAQAECERASRLAWAEYERAYRLAKAERDRACGAALLAALIQQRAAARRAQQEAH